MADDGSVVDVEAYPVVWSARWPMHTQLRENDLCSWVMGWSGRGGDRRAGTRRPQVRAPWGPVAGAGEAWQMHSTDPQKEHVFAQS